MCGWQLAAVWAAAGSCARIPATRPDLPSALLAPPRFHARLLSAVVEQPFVGVVYVILLSAAQHVIYLAFNFAVTT